MNMYACKTVSLLALVGLLFSFVSGAFAAPAALSIQVGGADVSAFPQVAVSVTVRDANGVPVPDLSARDFEVNEDRVPESRSINAVTTQVNPELPVGLVLVVDVSGSMAGQPLSDAQTAARTLVEQLGAQDEVAFIAFADTVDLDGLNPAREHPPTTDRRIITALIDGLQAQGGTPLYDAFYKGVQWAEQATLGQRAVILLTDGVDEDPGSAIASAETPIQEATRANVPIFTIGLGSAIDRGYLERVARATGGVYQETPDSAQLTELFLNVLHRLKQEYVITYESGLPGDGALHRVQVRVEVAGRQAMDEADLGPLPSLVAAPSAVTETVAASEPVTDAADIDDTDAISAEGLPAQALSSPTSEVNTSTSSTLPWWLLAGSAAVVLIGAAGWSVSQSARRKRLAQQEYCSGCGRELAPGATCPTCGPDAGRFQKPVG